MTGMASRYSYGGTYGGVFHFSDYRFVNRSRKNAFFGVKGKIRPFRLKRKPRGEILERILKTYGERIFYNDFDRFLTKNDVICNIIRNCTNVLAFDYKSQSQLVILLCSTICGGTPHYARYYYEFRAIMQYYFEIVFNSLNRIPDENARVICNVAKELANGLNSDQGAVYASKAFNDWNTFDSKAKYATKIICYKPRFSCFSTPRLVLSH